MGWFCRFIIGCRVGRDVEFDVKYELWGLSRCLDDATWFGFVDGFKFVDEWQGRFDFLDDCLVELLDEW